MRLTFFILAIALAIGGFAQEKIHQYEGSFDEALEQANSDCKNILLYITNDWCSSGKRMNQTLENEHLASFISNEFIFYHVNIDQAKEKELKRIKKYNKKGWPRLYFMDSEENIIYFHEGCSFLENDSVYLFYWSMYPELDDRWDSVCNNVFSNHFTNDDLKEYIRLGFFNPLYTYEFRFQFRYRNRIHKYFELLSQEKWSNQENWFFYQYIWAKDNEFKYLEGHKDQFTATIGEEIISNYIYQRYINILKKTKSDKRESKANELICKEEAQSALQYVSFNY